MGTNRNPVPVVFASEADVPRPIRAARRAVEDARAYAAKPPTTNLEAFRVDFVRPIFAPLLAEEGFDAKTTEAILRYAATIAGTYSRYQEAKRADLLAEIATPTAYRIGKAPTKRPAKVAPKVAAPKPGPVVPKTDATA